MVGKKSLLGENQYIILVTSGAILATIFLIIVILRPLWANVQQSQKELTSEKAVLEKSEKNLAALQGLSGRKDELTNQNEKVLAALPSDKDVPRLFVQMEEIATRSGLAISTVSETTDASSNTTGLVNQVKYQVNGTANSYAALKQSLSDIEKALRLLSVNKIDIQSKEDGSLNINLTVTTYKRGL